MREKLIELLECTYGAVADRDYDCYGECKTCQAENLIANGVGFLPKWIPVTERLPQGADGKSICENVIAYLDNGDVVPQVCPGWLNGDKWYLLIDDYDYHTVWGLGAVTHWMPLPQPPKGE